jgi:hypothetical protein
MMRLLLVEDEVKMAGLLKRGLEEEGYAVDVATGSRDAVWLGTENDYDAIDMTGRGGDRSHRWWLIITVDASRPRRPVQHQPVLDSAMLRPKETEAR